MTHNTKEDIDMRKLIAVLVALMLLALPFASAETVAYFADPTLKMSMGGQDTNIDLTGLELCIAAKQVGENIAAKIFVNGQDKMLYAIDFNVVGTTVLFTATGLSDVFSATVPEEALQSVSGMEAGNFQVPDEVVEKVTGILMSQIEMNEEDGSIHIPYTAVNDILSELVPYLGDMNIPGLDTNDLAAKIDQLKQSNSGLDLVGTFASDDEGNTAIEASVYLAKDGVVDENAVFALSLAVQQNGFVLIVDLGDMGSLAITFVDGELAVAVEAQGTSFELSGKVGTKEADVEIVELDGTNAIDVTTLEGDAAEQLGNQMMMGASELMSYVYSALVPAA